MLFSLASAQNLHEGPGLLLDLSCLFMDQNDILITTTKQVIKLEREESSGCAGAFLLDFVIFLLEIGIIPLRAFFGECFNMYEISSPFDPALSYQP